MSLGGAMSAADTVRKRTTRRQNHDRAVMRGKQADPTVRESLRVTAGETVVLKFRGTGFYAGMNGRKTMTEYRKCVICGCCYTDGDGNVCDGCAESLRREKEMDELRKANSKLGEAVELMRKAAGKEAK